MRTEPLVGVELTSAHHTLRGRAVAQHVPPDPVHHAPVHFPALLGLGHEATVVAQEARRQR
eukprot:5065220-Lingulodinium_polyedra.AAC.1